MRAALIVALLLTMATTARAQTQPSPYAQPQPYAQSQQYAQSPSYAQPPYGSPSSVPARDEGWALGGGVFGLVAAGTVLALAASSEETRTSQVPSLPLGVTATVLFTASVPIVAAASSSARHGNGALGVPALRVLGWIAYGCALAEATALIGMGAAQVTPPEGVIISTGLLGTASLGMMSIDALVSRGQAREEPRTAAARRRLSWQPAISARTVGVAATF